MGAILIEENFVVGPQNRHKYRILLNISGYKMGYKWATPSYNL